MKIALIGATGTIGQRILNEALTRGHKVTAIVRDTSRLTVQNENLILVQGDIFDRDGLAKTITGHDVVISAYGPKFGVDAEQVLVDASKAIVAGVKQAGVGRLLAVGGAGSLEVAPGVQLVDTPEFPDAWKGIALAHRDALEVYQNSNLDWTVLHPAALIEPGERTGTFRLGTTQLVSDDNGNSRISAEDYAVALLDEVEKPQFIRQRFTVAY